MKRTYTRFPKDMARTSRYEHMHTYTYTDIRKCLVAMQFIISDEDRRQVREVALRQTVTVSCCYHKGGRMAVDNQLWLAGTTLYNLYNSVTTGPLYLSRSKTDRVYSRDKQTFQWFSATKKDHRSSDFSVIE